MKYYEIPLQFFTIIMKMKNYSLNLRKWISVYFKFMKVV